MQVPEVGFKQWTSDARSFTHTACKISKNSKPVCICE
jgi:hypothetical protein